jgi:hypothetical protein
VGLTTKYNPNRLPKPSDANFDALVGVDDMLDTVRQTLLLIKGQMSIARVDTCYALGRALAEIMTAQALVQRDIRHHEQGSQ